VFFVTLLEAMFMYKRIIMAVACVLFSLLAMLAVIITDLKDQDYPHSIDVENRLSFDFSKSNLSIDEGFELLTKLGARWDIGLVKIASDLVNKNNNKVFITLNNEGLPDEFTWFNENDKGEVVDKGRLENSYPDKTFLFSNGNL